MTRDEKRAKALELRTQGLSWPAIDVALGYSKSGGAWKLAHPDQARESNRRSNAERAAAKREWARTARGICSRCGGPQGSSTKYKDYDLCCSCHLAEVERKRQQIVAGYRDGLTSYEFAAGTGIPEATVRTEAWRLRRSGVDVPFAPLGGAAHREHRTKAAA